MRKTLLTGAALICFAGPALADGRTAAQRAADDYAADLMYETRARSRANTAAADAEYDALVRDQQFRETQRLLQENNRMLRERR